MTTAEDPKTRFQSIYDAFNRRDLEALLPHMHPGVEWPNGWEGGYVHGRDEVRDYWIRQWQAIDPRVTAESVDIESDGHFAVTVHQVVRELDGTLIADTTLEHIYTERDGLITHMEIRARD
jgi:ketosteroid isomerase-like protein